MFNNMILETDKETLKEYLDLTLFGMKNSNILHLLEI